MHSSLLRRRGMTLPELMVVLAIAGVLAGTTLPIVAHIIDGVRLRGAVSEIVALFATARSVAIMRSTTATVKVDTASGTVLLFTPVDTLERRPVRDAFAVSVQATRDSVSYGPTGMGWGAANTRIIVRRGALADTITTSRLGRVKH